MKSRVLAGIAILALIVAAVVLFFVLTGGNATSDREIPGMGNPDYMLTGSDDTLYLFSGDNISAVSSDGRLKYRYVVPDGWSICHSWYVDPGGMNIRVEQGNRIVSEDNGSLYLYLKPVDSSPDVDWNDSYSIDYYGLGKLVAIGPDGRQRWNADVTSHMVWLEEWIEDQSWALRAASDTNIQVRGGLVYVFHGYNESVYGTNGTILWTVPDVSDPGNIDQEGNLYLMEAMQPLPIDPTPQIDQSQVGNYRVLSLPDYRVPGSVVDSYYPNSTQRWRQYSLERARRQYLEGVGSPALPLYYNETAYVIFDKSVTAIGSNGSKLWIKRFSENDYQFQPSDSSLSWLLPPDQIPPETYQGGDFQSYWFMPFDADGNLYIIRPMIDTGRYPGTAYLITLATNGSEISSRKFQLWDFTIAGNNVIYKPGYTNIFQHYNGKFDDLETGTLSAYDPLSGKLLWNYTVPTDRKTTLIINASNYRDLVPESEVQILNNIYNSSRNWNMSQTPSGGVFGGVDSFSVHPGKGMVYIDFRAHNYEYPIVLGQSKYVYSSGVYALGSNGTLLWYVPMAPRAEVLSASNNTIIYNTVDGKTYVKALGAIAGGVVLVSGAYLAFYFFAGTVTRARGRLDKNGNRTDVFRYIAENPGSTLYEIARGTGVNIGTVRYHLFILGTNHRIIAHQTGEKFVRYFTNAGTYGARERTIISLLRRDVTGKVLRLLVEQSGIGNADIARELGIHESVAHRSVKELLDKGILTREAAGRGFAYMLTDDDRALVIKSVEKMAGHTSL